MPLLRVPLLRAPLLRAPLLRAPLLRVRVQVRVRLQVRVRVQVRVRAARTGPDGRFPERGIGAGPPGNVRPRASGNFPSPVPTIRA